MIVKTKTSHPESTSIKSFLFALLAYTMWGTFPLYWKTLSFIPSEQLVFWRVLITLFTLVSFITLSHKQLRKEFFKTFSSLKKVGILFVTGTLIVTNWGAYIAAINAGHIVDASLGYFMTPLINIALGVLFLKEKLKRSEIFALILASSGFLYTLLKLGFFPWISLFLSVTFTLYGLIRKIIPIDPLIGLGAEITLTTLPFLIVMFILSKTSGFALSLPENVNLFPIFLLSLSGVLTVLPLWAFNKALKGLRLSSIGFIQYLSPSLQFLTGVFIFHEKFEQEKIVSFACVWLALLILSLNLFFNGKNKNKNKNKK